MFLTERRGHARELAAAAVARGVRLVLAWGGDGTINEVASALAFGDVPIGIIPAGSGNGLACELGIDLRPEYAIRQALGATPRPMDMGELDSRLFVNLAGIGFDAHVAARFNDPRNYRRGFVTYAGLTLHALTSYVPGEYTITTPEERVHVRAVMVTLANATEFGNGARIAPHASIDDGLLDLVIVEERTRWRTICGLPRLFNGTVDRLPGYSTRPIDRATIESDHPMVFHVDGETVHGGTSLGARVHPGALRLAAGALP